MGKTATRVSKRYPEFVVAQEGLLQGPARISASTGLPELAPAINPTNPGHNPRAWIRRVLAVLNGHGRATIVMRKVVDGARAVEVVPNDLGLVFEHARLLEACRRAGFLYARLPGSSEVLLFRAADARYAAVFYALLLKLPASLDDWNLEEPEGVLVSRQDELFVRLVMQFLAGYSQEARQAHGLYEGFASTFLGSETNKDDMRVYVAMYRERFAAFEAEMSAFLARLLAHPQVLKIEAQLLASSRPVGSRARKGPG